MGAVTLLALDTSKLKQQGHVNDFSQTLDAAARDQIESYCTELEQKTGAQMAIVIVKTLDDEPAGDVATRLFKQWEVGKKKADQGILLLIAVDDVKESEDHGDGLESALPGQTVSMILDGTRPSVHLDSHGQVLLDAARKIGSRVAKAKGVAMTPPPRQGSWFGPAAIILYVCIAALIAGVVVIIPGLIKVVKQTFLSITTWYTLIAVGALIALFVIIGHDRAENILGLKLVSFLESAWPLLVTIVVFLLFASRGDPLSLVFGSSGKSRRRRG